MSIAENLKQLKKQIPSHVTLVAVTKTRSVEEIKEAVSCGQLDLGENKVQEILKKFPAFDSNVRWHMIGHLQKNKVKSVLPYVYLIHSVDSEKLLKEINKEAKKINKTIKCLLQIHIAKEETKYGLDFEEAKNIITIVSNYPNIEICGLMGMATNTEHEKIVSEEFNSLKVLFDELKSKMPSSFSMLSMGMSGDYQLAIKEGSNMIRIGTAIFGERDYTING